MLSIPQRRYLFIILFEDVSDNRDLRGTSFKRFAHQGYFTDKQSERLYKYKHITNHRKFG